MIATTWKLALQNIRKSKRTFLPFMFASMLAVMMVYLISSLQFNPDLGNLPGGTNISMMMGYGGVIIVFFTTVFLFYTNSFLIKSRQTEFGLLHILGLQKKHIAIILFWELLLALFFSLTGGILLGMLLDKAFFMLIARLLEAKTVLSFTISKAAIAYTMSAALFTYGLLYLWSLLVLAKSDPMDMLKAEQQGQKEPKSRWLLAILGVLFLGSGYAIAIKSRSAMDAFFMFFIAVLLVMAGTYLLFSFGITVLLKTLQKHDRFYYQTSHFITISSLKYRMKSSAISLASICILSTMVLVTVSTTSALVAGLNEILSDRLPYDINSGISYKPDESLQKLEDLVNTQKIVKGKPQSYKHLEATGLLDQGKIEFDRNNMDPSKAAVFDVVTLSDYNKNSEVPLELNTGEVALYSPRLSKLPDSIEVNGRSWKTAVKMDTTFNAGKVDHYIFDPLYIVVPDDDSFEYIYQAQKEGYGDNASEVFGSFSFNIPDNLSQEQAVKIMQDHMDEETLANLAIDTRDSGKTDLLGLYGGLLFLGIFVSLILMIACVLIMYYKQISEGLEDQKRFVIMKNVGIDEKDIRKTIRFQVLLVFFLPLIAAGIHTCFAFPMILKLMKMLQFNNTNLFITVTLIVFACFGILYIAAYTLTSKVYYQLVQSPSA